MTATKAELQALLERVDAATGGPSNLDAEIYATIGGAPNTTRAGQRIIPLILKGDPQDYPAYTASIDAALALVERTLPEWRWGLHCHNGLMRGYVVESSPLRPTPVIADLPTAPLAILAALLKALIDQADEAEA